MITAQAFQVTPREHAPAVVIGILPGVAAWGAVMAKNGLRAAGLGNPQAALRSKSHPTTICVFRSPGRSPSVSNAAWISDSG